MEARGRYLSEVQDYYLAHADYPAELNDFDFGLLYEAMAFVSLSHPSLEFDRPGLASLAIAEWTNQENKYLRYSGNSLTYPEAYLFTKYLVAAYGLDDMLTYCTTYTTTAFENNFSLSYTEAFADFRAEYDLPQ